MAHYFLPVILPLGTPDDSDSKLSALETLMHPHRDEEWDWYRVGGGWDGAILGKSEGDYYNDGEDHEQIDNNCTVVSSLITRLEQEKGEENALIPYFLLTPDGQWLCNDNSDRNMYLSVLSEYPNCFVVGVDIHN